MTTRWEPVMLAAIFCCAITISIAIFFYEDADEKGDDIVIVSVINDAGQAAVTSSEPSGPALGTGAATVGSDAGSVLDPAAEAVLNRGTQVDILASQRRMLERQKFLDENATSAIDTQELP